jgi:RNA polymerase sigma factor (sigma-70 family)
VSPSVRQRIEQDSSFERLYRLHRRDVYGAVLRDVRDPAEAEDVTQTAFLNAYRAMRKGEEPEKPRAWLVTIARNVIRRRYRELMRRPQEVHLDPDVAMAVSDVEGPTAGEIAAAIRRLPANQRRVILLREIQGRSYAEIADEMGLSRAAVETLIFRARRSLAAELEVADRVPSTREHRRGLFLLPLPGFPKLSFGFSLTGAGAAALVGSIAILTAPLDSGGDPPRQPAVQGGSPVEAVWAAVARPSNAAAHENGSTKARKPRDKRGSAAPSDQNGTAGPPDVAGTASSVPDAGLPIAPDAGSLPPPPLAVEPPPVAVEPPPVAVEPPPLPDLPPAPSVEPPPLPVG